MFSFYTIRTTVIEIVGGVFNILETSIESNDRLNVMLRL